MLRRSHKVVKSLGEQVYDYLFEQLKQKALAPGTYLDLDQIAARLGISRTPLRDALLSLELEGYVEIVPRRGVLVKHLELEEVRDLYQVIGALEATAMLAAAPGLGPEDHRRLREMTDDTRAAWTRPTSTVACSSTTSSTTSSWSAAATTCWPAPCTATSAGPLRLGPARRAAGGMGTAQRGRAPAHGGAARGRGTPGGPRSFSSTVHWSFQGQESYVRSFYGGGAAPAR